MAIAQVLKGAAKAAKVLGKKKSRQAVRASKSTLSKAKNLTSKAGTKLKGAATAAAGTRTAQMAAEKGRKIAGKIGEKIPKRVKDVAQSTAAKATTAGAAAGAAAKEAARKGAVKAKDIGNKVRADADILATAAQRSASKAGKVLKNDAGVVAAKTISGTKKLSQAGKEFAKEKPFLAGMATQGALDIPVVVAAGAIGASVAAANSSPEQMYDVKRMSDGRFATTFKDKNRNSILSSKSLSQKDIDDIRTQLAILDSIVLSDDPQGKREQFAQVLGYLADEYRISNITGKNLSIIIPNIEGGVQTRRRF